MANPSPVYDSFYALYKCVRELHFLCKQNHTVENLIDTFYHFHGLASAFTQDCHKYLPKEPVTQELQKVVGDINEELQCSYSHIQAEANRLNTTIIDRIVEKLNDPESSRMEN